LLEITVLGKPEPQGSTKAFIPKGWNRAVITTDNRKLKPWRQDVATLAQIEMAATGHEVTSGPVAVHMVFYFAKPKSASKKVVHKTTKPDADKLVRGIFDALTGIVFADDSQVVDHSAKKLFGLPERAEIQVVELAN
jgi:Holliday junction resolvase RusA-like endonuclease